VSAHDHRRLTVTAHALVLTLGALALTLVPPSLHAQTQVARTVHNLTPGGSGQLKETRPVGLCVFCHTPHNANPIQALWNRDLPPVTYQLYSSSTLQAVLNQPTGSSRLCLSCHDGILALSTLRVPPQGDPLELGRMTGSRHIGTDLRDDHPVSFVFDGALAVQRGDLVDPTALPSAVRLDASGQMQCTSCHDPHEDRRPHFLRMDPDDGALCLSCHRLPQWASSSHATSLATWNSLGTSPWREGSPPTVAANACNNCHRTHAAGQGPRLLAWPVEVDNCAVCHQGNVAAKDVAAQFTDGAKISRHPVGAESWLHDPRENPAITPRHVTCVDCHNPHATDATPAADGIVSGALRSVPGITTDGSALREALQEHEVCNKCHGPTEPVTPGILRAEPTRIVRLKIDPSNASFHPVAAVGRNATIAGLRPGYTASSRISCIDCHNNDDWMAGSLAPKGPHASRYSPILVRQYRTEDRTPESFENYELCYQCHDRDVLLTPRLTGFPHATHVVDRQASCATCHDAHGSRQNAHLINFMVRDLAGATVVAPDASGRLEYVANGPGRGTCYLQCHGADHGPRSYPD
jgi:predicted CXXCH cytochrome family protein